MKTIPVKLSVGFGRACASVAVTAAVFSAAFLAGISVKAGTTNYSWNNAGSDFYTNDANWLGGVAPMGAQNTLAPMGSVNYIAYITNGGTVLYGDGGGGPSSGYTWTNVLGGLMIGSLSGSSGAFTMSSDSLVVSNTGGNELVLGGGANSTASLTVSGGTLTAVRDAATFFQDFFIVGGALGANATFNLSGGIVTNMGGLEIANAGTGTLNVSGGELVDNGWFGVGRGGTSGNSSGNFNLSGGTVYIIPNVGDNASGQDNGVYVGQGSTNASTVNVSGGSVYCVGIGIGGAGAQSSQYLNISGGTLYLGYLGVHTGNGSHFSTISGGTFHTVDMVTNTAANQGSLGAILSDGTNWTWGTTPAVNLTNSSYTVNGVSGPGYVTFAPEANRTITLNNQWTGVGGLVINGPGTVAMGAANTYTGGTTISQGNLTFNSGGSVADPTLTIPSGSTLTFNITGTETVTNVVTGPGNVVLVNTGVLNFGSNLQNSGAVIQTNGILVLDGTIVLPNEITNSAPAADPLVLQGDIMSPIGIGTNSSMELGTTVVPGTLNASNVTLNGTWDFKINTPTTPGGGTNDLLVCSNLTLNPGSSVLNIIAQSEPSAGTYVIGEYSGTVTGSFGLVTNGLRNTSMSVNFSGGQILLTVGASNPANLTWSALDGAANVNWDVNTSSNWTNSATSALDVFHQQDNVTFTGTPGVTPVTNRVSITTLVTPNSITISGGLPYIITGVGKISGGTGITYNDTNTSGIYTSGNNYTGPVNIDAGVLQLGISASGWLGATNGATYINGGTLDLNGQSVGAEPLVIQGSGSAFAGTNSGAINNSGTESSQNGGPLNVTLAGDTTLNASGARWDIGINKLGAGGGSFVGNNFNLTKIGSQAIWMHEIGDIGVDNIDVQQGTLGLEYNIGLGNPSGTLTVESGATLSLYQVVSNLDKQVVLNGNASVFSGGGTGTSNNLVGPVTLNGTNSINTSGYPLNLPGNITGTGGFTLSGTGPLYLGGDDTYSGSTIMNANSHLAMEAGASIPNTPLIYMAPGSNTLVDASGAGSMTLNSGQMVEGAGLFNGNITANAGSSIVPGTNATTYGTFVFNNNLTLNGNTNFLKISDNTQVGIDNDLLQINGTLTLNGVSTLVISPLAALNTGSPYTVMQAGGINGSAANLKVVSTSPRYTMTPVVTGNSVQVNIMGNAAPLEWEGYLTPNWDLVTSNWLNMGTATADHFYNGDDPTFDDTAPITSVVVTNNVIVGGIYMSNVAKTYTFTGGGIIAGGLNMYGNGSTGGTVILATSNAPALTYVDSQFGNLVYNVQGVTNYTVNAVFGDSGFTGAGIVTFGGTNTALITGDNSAGDVIGSLPAFDGTIWVTNGVLRYTNQSAFGDSTLGYGGIGPEVFITNNGTLDFNNVGLTYVSTVISGNGFNGEGALYDSANNVSSGNSGGAVEYVTLAGDASFGSPANLRWDQNTPAGSIGGQINGNGFKLTKVGLGTVFLDAQEDGDTHLGDIEVAAGRLGFQGGPVALGNAYLNNVLSVDSNAVVTFYSISNQFDSVHNGIQKPMWLKGDAQVDSGGSSNNYGGPIFLTGTNVFGPRSAFHIWNSIMDSNGPGGFILGSTVVGAASANLWLDGNNSYSGPTIISNRTVRVGENSSLGVSSYVLVTSGATLDLSATPAYSFGANQTVVGNGTLVGPATGDLDFNAGSTLAIGLPTTNWGANTNTFTFIISNSVVLNPGSSDYVVANKTSASPGAVPVDRLAGPTSLTLGGTLIITNYGNSFVAGDTLALFSAATITTNSSFNIVPATPGPNLAWNISSIPVNGTVSVVSTLTVNPNPTNIVFSISGGKLNLSWPADHTGWELEIQTNSLSTGINTNWVPYPGSTSTDSISIPVNLVNGTVFYRLVYPPQ